MSDDKADDLTPDDKIVAEAKKRFAICEGWESHARSMYVEDQKFAHGDSDNMYQWPNALLTTRELNQRPTLTVNKTRIHCLQIINDAKQNKPGIVVEPTTNEASYEAAEVYEDVVRHIENRSRAQQAYDKASENQVFGGIGYCRIVSDYVDPNSFDQELLIRPVPDPLTVYMDPDAKEADKSDSEYAFVFDDMSPDKANRLWPDHEAQFASAPLGAYDGWIGPDHVRIAEYWRRTHTSRKLVSIVNPETGERVTAPREDIDPELLKTVRKDPLWDYRERDADVVTVEWFKIGGSTILERGAWLGMYIPIVPCIGEETVIDGQMDRKGHVRYLKDPQRMYNYNTSSSVEQVALQTKTPYSGPAAAFEGYEEYYENANTQNLAFLPYNHVDDSGNPIPAPQRVEPPQMSVAFVKGMEIAQQEMMMASGQYQSSFGQNENATSGKAINERQRQGDNATYHFVDGLAIMIRQLGRILIDAIPKYYDTKRVLKIRGEDGSTKNVTIDPNAPEAVAKIKKDEDQVNLIFNPNIGLYSVEADVGPSFATRRQEAWNAIIQILTQSPQLIGLIGDLLFQNADFPGADEIAKRLRRMAPPQALGDDASPQDIASQEQMKAMDAAIQDLNVRLADKTAETNIKAFDALTKRITALGNSGPAIQPEQALPMIVQTEQQVLGNGLPQEFGAQPEPQAEPMMPPAPDQAPMGQQPMPAAALDPATFAQNPMPQGAVR